MSGKNKPEPYQPVWHHCKCGLKVALTKKGRVPWHRPHANLNRPWTGLPCKYAGYQPTKRNKPPRRRDVDWSEHSG